MYSVIQLCDFNNISNIFTEVKITLFKDEEIWQFTPNHTILTVKTGFTINSDLIQSSSFIFWLHTNKCIYGYKQHTPLHIDKESKS